MAGEEGTYRGLKRDGREEGSGNWKGIESAGALYFLLSYSASNSICASLRFLKLDLLKSLFLAALVRQAANIVL